MVNNKFYENAKIYKIVDNTNDNIYIGSTCKLLCQRLAQHRASYKRYLKGEFHFITSFTILENNDYQIILLENIFNCSNIEQLRSRERYYIDSMVCVNKVVPGRTVNEYYETNKKKLIKNTKEYQKANKEKIIEDKKKYYMINKEKLNEYAKEYLKSNKEIINEWRKTKVICKCGHCYTNPNKSRHLTSVKHQTYLNEQSIIKPVLNTMKVNSSKIV